MGEKITINGKEYTERNISFIEINGTKITDGMITPEISKNGPKISVNIQVDGSSFETSSSDFTIQGQSEKELNKNVEDIKENINNFSVKDEVTQEKESKNWIVKLIEKIRYIILKK